MVSRRAGDLEQARATLDYVEGLETPAHLAIIGGDFNTFLPFEDAADDTRRAWSRNQGQEDGTRTRGLVRLPDRFRKVRRTRSIVDVREVRLVADLDRRDQPPAAGRPEEPRERLAVAARQLGETRLAAGEGALDGGRPPGRRD